MPRRLLIVSSLLAAGIAAQESASAEAALARTGEARAVYERAWRDTAGAERTSYEFLLQHMPERDIGKVTPAELLENVRLAHTVRAKVAWGASLSDEMFRNYVVPYAQANEKRESWRPMMIARFLPLVADCKTPGEAGLVLNKTIFNLVNVHYSTKRRRADQSPSESIEQGMASCTGLSILLADACRACSVPARLVSVRWPHKRGNHTWVEIWDGSAWRFVGADEPDPKGYDRAWFVGDAQKCEAADRAHRIWAVSFAKTADRIGAGWGVRMWGHDVTARYAKPAAGSADEGLRTQIDRFFAADAKTQANFSFDMNLDAELKTKAGDARLRKLVWQSLKAHDQKRLQADHDGKIVRAGDKESPFTVKQVGEKPAGGWPLVIAMHGGGGVAKEFNDSQWRHMQRYYHDHPEAGGYLYCALRAPTDEWNGFYTDYFYPLMEKLIRQFVVCSDVDPDRVIAIGYSHGGYGAFAVGPKMPHRFSAVHGSAAAPTDGQSVVDGLHSLAFSFMVGGKDTRYGRRSRCEAFAEELAKRKKWRPDLYPTRFTLVEDRGHGGLPDRDLLPELLPHVRTAVPKQMWWQLTDATVKDHYWVHVKKPVAGKTVTASLKPDGTLSVLSPLDVDVRLDARWIDMGADLQVHSAAAPFRGKVVRMTKHKPAPSLRTLCQTMQQLGDPQLAASWVFTVKCE